MNHDRLLFEDSWNSCPYNVQYAREAARAAWLRYSEDDVDLIELAIGEACANAVEHGSPRGEASRFTFRCYLTQDSAGLAFEVADEGPEFQIGRMPLTRTPDLYSEGGRGLFLIYRIMDSVELVPTRSGLTVRMVKQFHTGYALAPSLEAAQFYAVA